LFQNELSKLHNYKNFSVKVKGIDETFKAKKELLYPLLDPKDATVTLRLSLDNVKGLLRPGMYAKLFANEQNSVKLVVPHTAVIRKNNKWYAFLATDFKGLYEPISIEIKPLNNTYYEVIKGLTVEDTLVNNALFMMDSDAQINSIY